VRAGQRGRLICKNEPISLRSSFVLPDQVLYGSVRSSLTGRALEKTKLFRRAKKAFQGFCKNEPISPLAESAARAKGDLTKRTQPLRGYAPRAGKVALKGILKKRSHFELANGGRG
jgi:hypothetical protein